MLKRLFGKNGGIAVKKRTGMCAKYISLNCEILSKSNTLLAIGYVFDGYDDTIEVKSKEAGLSVLSIGEYVKVSLFDASHELTVLSGTVLLSTDELIKIDGISTIADSEKRNYFRVKDNTAATAYILNEYNQQELLWEHREEFEAQIIDLSLGGLLVKCEEELNEGEEINVRFIVQEELLDFDLSVKRAIYRENILLGYGCEFINPSSRSIDGLSKYLFERQREQIMSRKNM